MIIGIVGHEETKFTPIGTLQAKHFIHRICADLRTTGITSGHCHLGGIDIWAEEIAALYPRLARFIYPPERLSWKFYKKRNIQIAERADRLFCIAVDRLAPTYTGMRFDACYHCHRTDHVKGGGCWTLKYARETLGKRGQLFIIKNKPDVEVATCPIHGTEHDARTICPICVAEEKAD